MVRKYLMLWRINRKLKKIQWFQFRFIAHQLISVQNAYILILWDSKREEKINIQVDSFKFNAFWLKIREIIQTQEDKDINDEINRRMAQ